VDKNPHQKVVVFHGATVREVQEKATAYAEKHGLLCEGFSWTKKSTGKQPVKGFAGYRLLVDKG